MNESGASPRSCLLPDGSWQRTRAGMAEGAAKGIAQTIGEDILTVQYAWPVGKPLVDNLGDGVWEIRSSLEVHNRTDAFRISTRK